MGHFKSFLLGMLTAYGVYYITRKDSDGKSVLDDLLENPKVYMERVEEGLILDLARTLKQIIK